MKPRKVLYYGDWYQIAANGDVTQIVPESRKHLEYPKSYAWYTQMARSIRTLGKEEAS